MVSGRVVAVTVAAVLGMGAFSGWAGAQETKPVKPAKAAAAGGVLVDNRRDANLVELTLTSKAKGVKPAVIAKDVPAGGKVNAKLPAKGGCVYDVAGTFDDESTLEVSAVNLCKDHRLTLVE